MRLGHARQRWSRRPATAVVRSALPENREDGMADEWYYAVNDDRRGPVTRDALVAALRDGSVSRDALVWRDGLAGWVKAASIAGLAPAQPPPVPPQAAQPPSVPGRSVLGGIGARISDAADLPTISAMPVGQILVGGLQRATRSEDIEEELAVGTRLTTPALAQIPAGWPTPRIFWRLLGGVLAVYFLLYLGIDQFQNLNFLPGLIVIGSFVVPFTVVVLFFELNVPRNVSAYQVGKMLLLGGAVSLIATVWLFRVIPGSGVGSLIPALLTGVTEETGKALALLMVLRSPRYKWQLNGLLFGAAVGAGFAGFESAGYALRALLGGGGWAGVIGSITIRALLAPGGHVIWTAMVGSALWRVKDGAPFELRMLVHPDVLRRWGIAVVLHGLWDADLFLHPYLKLMVLVVVGWYIVLAILKQALAEVEQARAEATAV
jgi:RsiW-degrading membrane proteinase PrsW (M82 family)